MRRAKTSYSIFVFWQSISLKKSYPLPLAQPQAYLDQVQKALYNRMPSTKHEIQEINSLLKGPPKPFYHNRSFSSDRKIL